MGLDSVELVLTVEEAFAFSIPDQDAAGLDTVGKLYDYVIAHRFQSEHEGCLTSVTFYRIRRALVSVLQIPRKDVRVSTELSRLIPARRRSVWRKIAKAATLRLPELVPPSWVNLVVALATAGLTGVAFWLLQPGLRILGLPFAFLVALYVLLRMTTPLATEFRAEFATVGKLTKLVLAKNYGVIADACRCSNADEVWESLRSIIVEQLGVRPEDVTKEASFVKDLHIDS
jgi:acyl carrier protein